MKTFLLLTRRKVAQRAGLCVIPNEQRAEWFKKETYTTRPVLCVWNCPAIEEARSNRAYARREFVVFFHGSIVPARVPMTVIEAIAKLPDHVVLWVAGYETNGHPGYVQALSKQARALGLGRRFKFLGAVSRRSQLLEYCRDADVGLALMPMRVEDLNIQAMTGASNKPFDYLACELALLVSDLPEWRKIFVQTGYGLSCDPGNPDSIATALLWFLEHPAETRAMGLRGSQQIIASWNYERQFEPVLQLMLDSSV